MPDRGIYLRVTHLGTIPGSLLLADVGLGDGGRLSGIPRAGPHYVPANGYIDLQYTEPVALSYISGNIRSFADRGLVSAILMSGLDAHDAIQAWRGWADYSDNSGAQPTVMDTWTHLTNNGLGALTNTGFLPRGLASFYDVANNLIQLAETRVGDTIHVRVDLTVIPSMNNSCLHIRLWFVEGWSLERRLARMDEGAGVPYHVVEGFRFYVGREAVRTGGARVEVLTGSDSTVTVNGFFIELT
jgi:hypothetical protein